ncbi:MAG: spore protease YyaC [Tissierellia bacterium]|nr:spore protease YyaC [Tissierellia bacterium]
MNFFPRSNYVDSNSPFALSLFSDLVYKYLSKGISEDKDLVILCIGTDRSTGDSLGPLVGHKLSPLIKSYKDISLFGTLDNPVHAKNLESTLDKIYGDFKSPFIIAVDSSLGNYNKIGYISIKNTPLKPGSGVNKVLPAVGDISITGIVNVGGMMEFMVLQNTRLSIVMNMADIISKSLYISLLKYHKERDYILEK